MSQAAHQQIEVQVVVLLVVVCLGRTRGLPV